MKRLTFLLLAIAIIGCASAPRSVTGVYRPSEFAGLAYTYIAEFPVNKATKQEVLGFVGPPDKSYTSDGIEYLTYIIVENPNHKLQYIYYIKNDIVFDIKTINQNPFATTIYLNSDIRK